MRLEHLLSREKVEVFSKKTILFYFVVNLLFIYYKDYKYSLVAQLVRALH